MYTRILVPLDGSPEAEASLPHARSLASRLHAELLLLRVDAPLPNTPSARYPAEIEREADRYLGRVLEPMRLKGLRARSLVAYGDPADTIVRVAGEQGADLLVMAHRHRGGLARALAGGVTRRVIDALDVPVLVVRAADG